MKKFLLGCLFTLALVVVGPRLWQAVFPNDKVAVIVSRLREESVAQIVTRRISCVAEVSLDDHEESLIEAANRWAKTRDFIFGKHHFEARVPMRLLLGVDLGKLSRDAVSVGEDGGYVVTLPPIELLELTIDIASPECEIHCTAPSTRNLWDRLTNAPDYGERMRQWLWRLQKREFLTEQVLSRIRLDGEALLGNLPKSLEALFAGQGLRVTFVLPPVTVEQLVEKLP